MADLKISELTNLTAADPANDMIPIVDVSATPPASGSTKRISINNILACSPSATLASATITGDLTVDTSTLKVDSANNRVGIGTATPARPLDIVGSFQSSLGWVLTGTPAGLGAATRYIGGASTTDSWYYNAVTGGSHLWAFGESQAMRLDSNGLGVGASPSHKLDVGGGTGNVFIRQNGSSTSGQGGGIFLARAGTEIGGIYHGSWATSGVGPVNSVFVGTSTAEVLLLGTNYTERMRIDSSGNVISNVTGTAPTLATNSQMVFNLTSNTNLRISVRGTDGTTRTANITLA